MGNEILRTASQRILDIAIASLLGGLLGAVIVWRFPSDMLHAKSIIVSGESGMVSISGDFGINLHRKDYASAMLWFHEPGTGDPGTGGPALIISGPEGQPHQEYWITPSGPKEAPPPVIE
jgi:hypothetical protein